MEIVLGKLSMRTVPLLLVASLAGNAVGGWLLRKGPLFNVSGQPEIAFGWDRALWLVALLAPFMGLLGPLYYRLIHSFRPMRAWPFALAWSGMLVGLLSLKCPQVWGNGDVALLGITHSSTALLTLTLILGLRLIATAACVGAGTVGGVFTPTLFAGGAIGYLAASLLHIPNPAIFAILAMAAFLAAVTHAPLMAAFMTVELTGQWRFLPLILGSTFVAVFVARRLSPQSLYAIATPTPEEDEAESRQPMRALRLHLEPAAAVQPPADRTLDSSRTPVEALRGN
jgi:CIC family chloride channel protein